ncbi:hypothetical protein [Microbacterium paludicola]|uniref:hypothetical protein n=1 Tax=Microbacterium paludicola TaxID=300019 RepID=UPI0031E3285A
MDELKPTSRRRQEYTAPLSAPPLRASLVERAETAIRNPDVEKHLRMLLARCSKIRARFERPYARLREISLRVECDIARRERERAVTVTARRIAEWAQLEEDLASVRAEIAELLDPEPVIPPRARA